MRSAAVTLALVSFALAFATPGDARAAGARCERQALEAQLVAAHGHALLCAGAHGVRGHAAVRGLVPGDAYTVWWVYFDRPGECAIPGDCGEPSDFGGDDPLAVFGRMDSAVAPASGRLRFSGRIGGLRPSSGAQLWMWVFGHGSLEEDDGRRRARQLLTPEDPGAGAPHLGNHVDGALGFPAAVVVFDLP